MIFRKFTLTIGAGIVAIALFVALFSFSYLAIPTKTNDNLDNIINDVPERDINRQDVKTTTNHTHAALTVFVNGILLNFSDEKYQNKDIAMHFEDGDSFTLHKHLRSSWLGPFFESVNITLANNCLIIGDKGSVCSNFDKQIRFLVNGKINQLFEHYSPNENDRILVSYGNSREIPQQQNILDKIKISKS